MSYTFKTEGGKRTCVYYKACGSTENCSGCVAFKKEKKHASNDFWGMAERREENYGETVLR